ncbi:ATP-binding cassette domain-containing protein [Streptomyces kanasensis]|uniref:ATP-binding cassette domain-containing protein n=1 Tax=Streptomyces kanasensis TaxID=936756 RepID=UPI0036FEF9AC
MRGRGALRRLAPQARRFLLRRRRALLVLTCWSLLESVQTFLLGYGVARALDDGFLAGRPATGLWWLSVAAGAALVGGLAMRGVFDGLAGLVEPLRDGLVRRAVAQALASAVADPVRAGGASADGAAVSRLVHQTEMARDGFAGLVLAGRSFLFTALGALLGMASLAPALVLVVLPPLLLGLGLFLATLAPMAAAQRAFLDTDEALSARVGTVGAGLRDVVACGGRRLVAEEVGVLVAAEERLARRLARWAGVRTLALGAAGRLPVVALVVATPWLLSRGVTAGALLGALTYLVQSLLPAVHALMSALGAAGTRLVVVLDRFGTSEPALPGDTPSPAPGRAAGRAGPAPGAGPDAETGRTGTEADAGSRAGPGAKTDAEPRAEVGAGAEAGAGPGAESRAEPGGREAGTGAPPPAAATAGTPVGAPPGAQAGRGGQAAAVELRGVTFAYGPRARPVLDGLDLLVEPGEHLAVVGPSGMGKSTLLAVLAGVLDPSRGTVLVAGAPARPAGAPGPDPRRALLPQEAYVFTGTVRDNLRYLWPDAPPGDVGATVEALRLGPLVRRLGGLDATVDPSALSQGERQHLALGRAHLSPAPLLLLDEATCHLDPEAEEHAERTLAARPGTLVVVAHRLSSAVRADRVLVLDGTRSACAPHEALLELSPLYRDLVGVSPV